MWEPSDDEIREELNRQSVLLFSPCGLEFCPTLYQFDRLRLPEFPMGHTLLGLFGLSRNAAGWKMFASAFGYELPNPSDIQLAASRARESSSRSINWQDESYVELNVIERVEVTYHKRWDGAIIKKTKTIWELR